MKVIAVIPARYSSTRFPGKPLADICGRPMIWWVYQQVSQVKDFSEVLIATDDSRIMSVCESFSMKCMMTSPNLPEHISRIHEVSERIKADYYLCINGDEPLVSPDCINRIIPKEDHEELYFCGAMRKLTDPAETIDSANIKIVVSRENQCIYMSRTPVPYPKRTLLFDYYKYVGIECFSKKGLDFFVHTRPGKNEEIEDIDHLRFVENGKPIYFTEVDSESISVDTPKDLEKVRLIMQRKLDAGEIVL